MDSLPTGSIQSWLIVAAIGLTPILVFVVAGVIGWVLRRRWRGHQPVDGPIRAEERETRSRRVEVPPM
jgi:hypothetical protein